MPKLLERVSSGEVLEADIATIRSASILVFSFLMAYDNKNVGGVFGCNVTFCVPK